MKYQNIIFLARDILKDINLDKELQINAVIKNILDIKMWKL